MEDIYRKKHLFVPFILVLFVLIFVWFYLTESRTNRSQSSGESSSLFTPEVHYDAKFLRLRQVQTESFIPSADKMKQMDFKQLMTILHTYQDHFEFLCVDEKRIGLVFDGGKQVCVDPEIRPKPNNCLVYSFGSRNEYSFERDAIKWFGCDVHTFDPFSPSASRTPQGCTFHKVGLGGTTRMLTRGGTSQQIKSLGDIMSDLNHTERVIDILKVDIDLYEWEFMDNVIKTGLLSRKVKQYQVEIHWYDRYDVKNNKTNIVETLGILRNLYGAGFRIFSRERNVFCKGCTYTEKALGTDVTLVTEFSYINERFVSDFYDQSAGIPNGLRVNTTLSNH